VVYGKELIPGYLDGVTERQYQRITGQGSLFRAFANLGGGYYANQQKGNYKRNA
jgi:hypothetical protein